MWKEATRAKRFWFVVVAYAKKKENKMFKVVKCMVMKVDLKVWIEDVFFEDEVLYDDDGECVLFVIKGFSFFDDLNAVKLMNAFGGEDFWLVGF